MKNKKPHIPYFYIIQHNPSGNFYAGAKWGVDANPENFLVNNGYTTNSTKVNGLIETDGLSSFKIILILTDFGFGMSAHDYETVFLQSFDIAKNPLWLNKHNNTGKPDNNFCKTELGKILWSKARKKYLENHENMKKLVENCRKLHKNEEIQKRKSKNMLGDKNPFYGKTHTEEVQNLIKSKLKGRKVWNKGLTKENDASTFQNSLRMLNNNPSSKRCSIEFINGDIEEYSSISHAYQKYIGLCSKPTFYELLKSSDFSEESLNRKRSIKSEFINRFIGAKTKIYV